MRTPKNNLGSKGFNQNPKNNQKANVQPDDATKTISA